MLLATKTFLPPIEEYQSILKRIWDSGWVTNRGELVIELESKLKNYLQINNILITNNGTIPLQIAIKLLGQNAEIITTPYSYVASTSTIVWENCKPIFVDIDHEHLTIDEKQIENSITNNTKAILATHLYGNACNIEEIEKIAKKYKLAVIYDAAHCFASKYKGQSIFNYGDISTCSFHATKIFHTGEGGAAICNDRALFDQIYYSHNFGHNGLYDFHGLGINAKISELQAAMGLAVFNHIDSIILERKKVVDFYNNNLNFSKVNTIKYRDGLEHNYSYYPLIYSSEEDLLKTEKKLNELNIFTRRNFYPSLNKLNYLPQVAMPIAEDISKRTTCIPLSVDIEENQLDLICKIINSL